MPDLPAVRRFSIAPVKGLALLHPDEIELTGRGVAEDRRFFLLDVDGRHVDGLRAGPLVRVGAWTDPAGSRLRLTLPGGEVVEDDVRLTEPVVVRMYGRTVVGRVVEGPWAAAVEPFAGRPVRIVRTDEPGGTRVRHHSTLVGDGSLRAVERELGLVEPIDARRFRMTIELDGGREHEEDTWIGRRIGLGAAVLRISGPVPRCAMTTHDPDTGERDHDTLRAIRSYRGLRDGEHLDFGVYGEVEAGGRVGLGDRIRFLDEAAAAS
jgi:uncharacterized protein YcbX